MKSVMYSVVAQNFGDFVFPEFINGDTLFAHGVVEGRFYFAVPSTTTLPAQHPSLDLRVETLEGDTLAAVKKASGHYQTIVQKIEQDIRARYSVSDELKALREGDTSHGVFVESVIAKYAEEKALLGF